MKRPSFALFLLVLAAVSLVEACFLQQTPLFADDYPFKTLADKESLLSILAGTYTGWDGRIGLYLFNFSLFTLPTPLADGIYSCMPALTVCALYRLVLGRAWKDAATWQGALFLSACIWALTPAFGEIYLWRTGSTYAVSACVALAALFPFADVLRGDSGLRESPAWKKALLLPLYFMVGLTDYLPAGTVAVFAAYAFIHAALVRRQKNFWILLPIAGLCAGLTVMLASPGNQARISQQATDVFDIGFASLLATNFGHYKEVYLIFLALGLLAFFKRKQLFRADFFTNLRTVMSNADIALADALITAFLAFLIAASLVMEVPERAFAFAGLLLFSLLFISARRVVPLYPRLLPLGIVFFLLPVSFNLFCEYRVLKEAAAQDVQRRELLEDSAGQDICLPPYPLGRTSIYVLSRFDIKSDTRYLRNRWLAEYFGAASVTLCTREKALAFAMPEGTVLGADTRGADIVFSVKEIEALDAAPRHCLYLRSHRKLKRVYANLLLELTGMERPWGWREALIPLFYSREGIKTASFDGRKVFMANMHDMRMNSPLFLVDGKTGARIRAEGLFNAF